MGGGVNCAPYDATSSSNHIQILSESEPFGPLESGGYGEIFCSYGVCTVDLDHSGLVLKG